LAVNAVVTQVGITVDGEEVVQVSGGAVDAGQKKGQLISPLFDRLDELAKKEKDRHDDNENFAPFEGRILLQVDKKIPFSLVREVMFTAGQAKFSEFKFVVYGKE
jgi:biopolymer transport protein ExbD